MSGLARGHLSTLFGFLLLACAGEDGMTGRDGQNGQNGQNGAEGSNGVSSLLRIVDEPPGSSCPLGGKRIQGGLDTNGDGMLQDQEVTSTSVWCGSDLVGAIEGIAVRAGDPDARGISVSIAGTSLSTTTGALGAYRLENVPIGYHDVTFSTPGYISETRSQVAVLPGVYRLPTVELSRSRRVDTLAHASLRGVSPDGRAAVVGDADDHRIIDLATSATSTLGASANSAVSFTRDSARVTYRGVERVACPAGSCARDDLVVWEVATRRRRPLAESFDPVAWTSTPDGAHVVAQVFNDGSGHGTVVTWEIASGARTVVSSCERCSGDGFNPPHISPDGRYVAWIGQPLADANDDPRIGQVWDRTTGANTVLFQMGTFHGFKADSSALLLSDANGLAEIDLATGARRPVGGTGATAPMYLSDGRVVFLDGEVHVVDPSTGADVALGAADRGVLKVSADGASIYFGSQGSAFVAGVPALSPRRLGPLPPVGEPAVLAPDGAAVVFFDRDLGRHRVFRRATDDFLELPVAPVGSFLSAKFGPTAAHLAFLSWRPGNPIRGALSTMETATGRTRPRGEDVGEFLVGSDVITYLASGASAGLYVGALP